MASKLDPYRSEIEAALRAGVSINEIAEQRNVARSTAQAFVRSNNLTGADGAGVYLDDRLTQDPDDGPLLVIHRDYSHLEHLHMYPLGDIHYGSPECAEDALDEWLQYLVDTEGVSMLNTGDNFNAALRDSVSDVYTERYTLGEAREILTTKFEPIAEEDKFDGIIDGNHEWRAIRLTGDSPNAAMARTLDVAYSPSALCVVYHVGDQEYTCYLRHGRGGGATMGAAVNQLERQERIIDADVYVSGHTHTQVAFPKNTFVRSGDEIVRKKRMFVCSGSFLGYEVYAAIAGYAPAHIGAPRVFMDGRKHDIHASV